MRCVMGNPPWYVPWYIPHGAFRRLAPSTSRPKVYKMGTPWNQCSQWDVLWIDP